MPNITGNLYALTTLCPLRRELRAADRSAAVLTRTLLDSLPVHENSPMAQVPNTYLCRFFVLDDLVLQCLDTNPLVPWKTPCKQDHLQSDYLVFAADFHGTELVPYLTAMWETAHEAICEIWRHCVGFEEVDSAESFARYIQRCQVETTFCFNGSTDESLDEQLKGLYLKQELARFAFAHQHSSPEVLMRDFEAFIARTRPEDLSGPTWRAGASTLDVAVVGERDGSRAAGSPPSGSPPTREPPRSPPPAEQSQDDSSLGGVP